MTEKKIKESNKALRFNNDKLRYDLVHPWAHKQLVKVLTKGAKKYAERNWEKGYEWSTNIASALRHLYAIMEGEDYDEETGELHAAHLMCNAMFMTAFYKIHPEGDDRPHLYLKEHKIGLDIDEVLCDWTGAWCDKFDKPKPTSWHFCYNIKNDFENLSSSDELDEFYLNLKPLIKPEELSFEPHCYITSRMIDTELTQRWLQNNGFPTRPVYTVGHDETKVEAAKKAGVTMFVDDRYDNFVELNKNGILTFLMDKPHNKEYNVGYKRIKSLKELKLYIS